MVQHKYISIILIFSKVYLYKDLFRVMMLFLFKVMGIITEEGFSVQSKQGMVYYAQMERLSKEILKKEELKVKLF